MAKIKSKVSKKSKSPSSDWEILPIVKTGDQVGYSWSNSPSSSNTYELQGSANNTGVNKQMSEAQLAQARKRVQQQKEAEYNERARRIQESIAAQNQPLSAEQLKTSSQSTGDKLSLAMNTPYGNPAMYPTLSGYAEALDYINPLKFVGDLGAGLGSVPYNLQQGNYGQAALPVGQALLAGALAGVGAKGTGQFVNNLANPFAGMNFRKSNANKFTSEIDWGKWNPDTPKYPELISEYNAIEESTKKAGNWMKNPDGSPFQGSPEQFIQQQSSWFKKAFPEGFTTGYRGAHFHVDDFANRTRNDFATFFTDNLENAKTYTDKGADFFNPSINPIGEYKVEEGLYEIGIPSNVSKVIGSGEGRNWRLLNWDDKIAKGTTSKGYAERFQEELKDNALQEYKLSDYDQSKKYLSTDIYANYVKNPNNPETVAQINDVVDTMGDRFLKPNTVYAVDAQRTPIKSLRHNVGFFDMTNPNIYKSVAPYIGLGGLGAAAMQEKKNGGSVSDWEIIDNDLPIAKGGDLIKLNLNDYRPSFVSESTGVKRQNIQKPVPQKKQEQTIKQSERQSIPSKAAEVLLHPLTAISNYSQKGYIPDNFSKGEVNPIDYAMDVINPAFYANAGKEAVTNTGRGIYNLGAGNFSEALGDFGTAGLNALAVGAVAPFVPKAANFLTTQTPLRNTYNLLPEGTFAGYSKLRNPNKSYRVAGMDAYDDFVESGVLRSKTHQSQPGMSFAQKMQQRPTGFPSFQKGYADLHYLPDEGGVVFETSLPTFKRGQLNPVTGFPIKGRHYAHRVIDPNTGSVLTNIPGENISVFEGKPHWLKGHKQINPLSASKNSNKVESFANIKIDPEKLQDAKGFLQRRQFIKNLQKEGLVGEEFNLGDVNYAARSTDKTNKLTQLALNKEATKFRGVTGSLPEGGKGLQEYTGREYDMSKPAFGGNLILKKYKGGGSVWEIIE